MRQFVQKHYRSGSGMLLSGLLNGAISFSSGLSLLKGKADKNQEETITAASLKGDADTIAQLKPALLKHNVQVNGNSNNIIFCEGKQHSFQQIISALQQLAPEQNALIHAGGSNSIAGSGDKDAQGIAWQIG